MLRQDSILKMLALLAFLAGSPALADRGASTDEAYFEVKLLLRDRVWGREVAVDQWAAGRLGMSRSAAESVAHYSVQAVLETPWTFRWYPTLHEAKLGAAVHVEHPQGDPYDRLSRELTPLVEETYRSWWDSDAAAPGPSWQLESGRFWAERHRQEHRDPLPEHPTYPFHVLGPLVGRFGFSVQRGAIADVYEAMTSPWLATGWSRGVEGESVRGYGYWERRRPRWEPRVYEAFAVALKLLSWRIEEPDEFRPAAIAELVETLQPRARGVARTLPRSAPHIERHMAGEVVAWTQSESDDVGAVRVRVWRSVAERADELQLFVDDQGDDRFKLWIRVGYRPLP